MILIADSGSSKTDWILSSPNTEPVEFTTKGFNPFFISEKEIAKTISQKAEIKSYVSQIEEVHFFGEGCTSPDKREIVSNGLSGVLRNAFINVETDTLGSVYATCGNSKGFTSILGTASNVAFYDGVEVYPGKHGLGFILGDEGSGAFLGKKILTSYLYGKMPEVLRRSLKRDYQMDKDSIIKNVYQKPLPNLYLSSFAKFLSANRGNDFVEELLNSAFDAFFTSHLKPYSNYQSYPCHFVGSVAFHFQDVLIRLCSENKMKMGKIMAHPIKSLADFITAQKG